MSQEPFPALAHFLLSPEILVQPHGNIRATFQEDPVTPSVIRMAVGENDRLQGAWRKLLALLQGLGGPVQIVARIDQDIAMLRVLIIPT